MTALAENTKRDFRIVRALDIYHHLPVAAGENVFQGSGIVINAGFAEVATTAVGLIAAGVAVEPVDNTAGSDGDLFVSVRQGVWKFTNDGVDAVVAADLWAPVYFVDDDTVANTDGTGTRSLAGTNYGLDADGGVWVAIAMPQPAVV